MAGPWEDYTSPSVVASMVTDEAQRQGVDPDLALRVATQESGLHHGAVSPKGALGVMQLTPPTAHDMGVDPTDLAQNIQGGVGYLKQQLDRFGDPRLAAAAYNAGPSAVAKHGGVPPYAETQKYVDVVAPQQGQDAPPWLDYASPPPKAPGAPIVAQKQARVAPPKAADPTIAQDAVSGLASPFVTLGHDVMQEYRRKTANIAPPSSLMDAGKRTLADLMGSARMAGDVVGLPSAPIQAAVRPIARGVNRVATPYQAPQLSMQGGNPALSAPRALQGDEAQAATEGAINSALSAARPASPVGTAFTAPKPLSLQDVQAAKTAAYGAADSMGVAYSPTAQAKLADSIGYDLASNKINPKVTPKAHAMMEDVQTELRSGKPLTMTEMDQLRQSVERATGKADDAERFFGGKIKDAIDNFISSAGPAETVSGSGPAAAQALSDARDLNTRWRKMQEVSNRADSADLRASSTYAGGNQANATRQSLRPLIDPKSNQRLRNLTPSESQALNSVVRGTPGQNAMRVAGKLFDPRGLIGATAQALNLPTHGLYSLTIPAGMAASSASNRMTAGAVQKLLDLISVGGQAAKPTPVFPTLALAGRAPPTLLSPTGLTGAAEVAAPLARIPALREKQKTKARAR